MPSNMERLLQQMKDRKAATPQKPTISVPTAPLYERINTLNEVVDKPKQHIDLIGDDIAEQTKTLNPEIEGKIIFSRIEKLEQALNAEIPEYASILHTIHRALSKDDEMVHLLSDEQIGILIRAMKERKNVVLVEEKRAKTAKKPLSKTTLDDIM